MTATPLHEPPLLQLTAAASVPVHTPRLHRDLLVVTERLLREFADLYEPVVVLRCIEDADGTLRGAGVRNGFGIALESMVRARLREGCQGCASVGCTGDAAGVPAIGM